MASKRTIELILKAKDQISGVLQGARGAIKSFADGTVGGFKRAVQGVFNLKNAIASFAIAKIGHLLIKPAMDMQDFETQFAVFLGSTEKAKARLKELADFAANTPFQMPSIVRASRTLETLTKGALSTGDGLKMVGDVAAGVGEDIGELSTWFGRLYDGIQSGRPVGEAMARMQELGIISGDTRGQIEEMMKTNADSADVWALVTDSMARFDGMIEKTSETLSGRISTLKDNLNLALGEIGHELLPVIESAVKDLLAQIDQLRESGQLQEWGTTARAALETAYERLKALATFISENRELLKTVGMTMAGVKIMVELNRAVMVLQSSMVVLTAETNAAAAAQTRLQAASMGVAGALRNVAAIGVTAFAGWQVGKLLAELLGVQSALDLIAQGLVDADPELDGKIEAQREKNAQRQPKAVGTNHTPNMDQMEASLLAYERQGLSPDEIGKRLDYQLSGGRTQEDIAKIARGDDALLKQVDAEIEARKTDQRKKAAVEKDYQEAVARLADFDMDLAGGVSLDKAIDSHLVDRGFTPTVRTVRQAAVSRSGGSDLDRLLNASPAERRQMRSAQRRLDNALDRVARSERGGFGVQAGREDYAIADAYERSLSGGQDAMAEMSRQTQLLQRIAENTEAPGWGD